MARYANFGNALEERANNIANGTRNVDLVAIELRRLTSDIHAVFLFEDGATALLRKLCQLVGIAAEERVYENWTHFADYLRVPAHIAKNIGNWLKPSGGPVEHVLLAYVQESDAMLDRVIFALQKMKREDIILGINDDVNDLVGRVHSRPASRDANGVYRLRERPFVPRILESSTSGQNVPADDDSCHVSYTTEENNNGVIRVTREKKQVALTVMLTCARDGIEAERRIAQKLRSLWPKIGVVVLREQQEHLWAKHRVFILDCIKQVDIVMPIVTEGYMDAINGRAPNDGILSMFDVEQQYVKYIYDTMSMEYQRDGCTINRIRCILPNNVSSGVLEINPEMRTYFGEENMEELVSLILKAKRREQRKLRKAQELQESFRGLLVTA